MRPEYKKNIKLILLWFLASNFTILPAQVVPTSEWISLYSTSSTLDGAPVAVGSIIAVYDPDGVLCGETVVSETGKIGFLQVYRDDATTAQTDEGALPGDTLQFYVDNYRAISQDPVIWLENGQVEKITLLAVSNLPPQISQIPDQTIAEGQTFPTLNLSAFVSDPDNVVANLVWSVSGFSELDALLNGSILTVSVPDAEWSGSETLRLVVSDPGGLRDTAFVTYTVTPVNDPPLISPISNQEIDEGGTFPVINLSDHVTDPDHADPLLSWLVSGNISLQVNLTAAILTVTVPNAEWSGSETLRLIVADPGSLQDTIFVTYSVTAVNDAPKISQIPDQTIAEGQTFPTINLSAYVNDPDNTVESLLWTVTGYEDLVVQLSDNILTVLVPGDHWFGSETLRLIVMDPGGLTDTSLVTFTVGEVNHTPYIAAIPDQVISEGATFTPLNLNLYTSDGDDAFNTLIWQITSENTLNVQIADGYLFVAIPDENWFGNETVDLQVSDPHGLTAYGQVLFRVNPVNDAPVITNIPDQIISEGSTFQTIDLDLFVSDVDDPDIDLIWTCSGSSMLVVSILNHVASVGVPNQNWNGSELLVFRVRDPDGLYDESSVRFTVTPVNDPPKIISVPITGATQDSLYHYQVAATDPDPDDVLNFSLHTSADFLSIDPVSGLVSGYPRQKDVGINEIHISVTDPSGASDDQIFDLKVYEKNDAPQLSDIPDFTITEGDTFPIIPLYDYVNDPDHPDSTLIWDITGSGDLIPNVSFSFLRIIIPDSNWFGAETIFITVFDSGGLSDSDSIRLTVLPENDPPKLSSISNQTIREGEIFQSVYLPDYVTDPDNPAETLVWTIQSPEELNTLFHESLLTIAPVDSEWNGSASIKIIVTDPGELSDSADIIFSVTAVNDAPQISGIPDQSIEEGELFASLHLDIFVFDPDHDDQELMWTSTGGSNIEVLIADRQVHFTISDMNWNGVEHIILKVTDPEGLFALDTVKMEIRPQNDGPQIIEIPQISFCEDDTCYVAPGYFYPYISDTDNAPEELNLSISPGRYTEVYIEKEQFGFFADKDWFGLDTLLFIVNDGIESDSSNLLVTISPVNDPPEINLPDSVFYCDSISSILYIGACINDIESPDSLLTVLVNSRNDEVQLEYQNQNCSINFNFDNVSSLESVLYVTVTDDSLAMACDSTIIVYRNDISNLKHVKYSPPDFSLEQNYPNPFNPATAIGYRLSAVSHVKLSIFDIKGQLVATLVDQYQPAGSYTVKWDASDMASGIYSYVIRAGDHVATKKMILIR